MSKFSKVKGRFAVAGLILLLIILFCLFLVPSDETGFLGVERIGRSNLITELNKQLRPTVRAVSGYQHWPYILRFLFAEKNILILRINYDDNEFNIDNLQNYLHSPYTLITDSFVYPLTLREDLKVNKMQFLKLIENNHIKTVEDLLAGYGFVKFEVYQHGEQKYVLVLPKTHNLKHILFYTTY